MNKELFESLDILEKEKGISKEYMIAQIEAALANACRKEVGPTTVIRVQLDPVKKDMKIILIAEGTDEQEALDKLAEMIEKGFAL